MKTKLIFLTIIITSLNFFNGCESNSINYVDGTQTSQGDIQKGYLITDSFTSEELDGYPLAGSSVKEINIYLPPSYYNDEDENFPVVYYLHGFGEGQWRLTYCKDIIDEAMNVEGINEFIIVEVDGMNDLNGAFYYNSVATGNNEDYVVNEVVDFIDENYKTIAEPSARGIAGFSMGGFGAVNLALYHPDVYSAVLAYCPCIMKNEDLKDAVNEYFDDGLDAACGAAFSPNLEIDYPYAEIPQFDGSEKDNAIIKNWENGMGNLDEKVEDYLSIIEHSSENYQLNAIKLIYAESDYFQFIPEGTKYLSEVLNKNNIEHKIESFAGGHDFPFSDFGDVFVVFFSENLK